MATRAVEVWRGGVDPWECDSNGHLNVRFYVARASEGLAGLAAAMGMPGAFTEAATATLQVREHHIRFVREARPDDALVLTGGVLAIDESEARLLFLLVHAGSGDVSAAIQARVAHVTPHDGQAFPWPERVAARARELSIEVPEAVRPRSLQPGGPAPTGSLARALELGLPALAGGAVRAQDCDVFGRLDAEGFMARISDGYAHWAEASRRLAAEAGASGGGRKLGGAAVEMRLAYARWPRAGDRIEVRSGLRTATPKVQTVVHWLLDPVSGQPWCGAEHVVVALDLEARRLAELPPELVAAMQARAVAGLEA